MPAALPNNPDPAPDRAALRAPTQPRARRLLRLLRQLIAYGQDLARTVHQRAAAGTLFTIALQFGTSDVALILARISRGLLLAHALEARLLRHPGRQDTASAPVRAPADRAQRAPRQAGKRPSLPELQRRRRSRLRCTTARRLR